jgi:DNA-binding transcriptional LysR family regulator
LRSVDLIRGDCDLAVRTPRPRQPALSVVKLGDTTTGLYATRDALGGLRRVDTRSRGLRLLTYSARHHTLQSALWFHPVASSTRVLVSNSSQVLLEAARAGADIAVLPRVMAERHGALVSVSEDLVIADLWLATHTEVHRDPKVRIAVDFLRRAATDLA